jgi:hypothetical protein
VTMRPYFEANPGDHHTVIETICNPVRGHEIRGTDFTGTHNGSDPQQRMISPMTI